MSKELSKLKILSTIIIIVLLLSCRITPTIAEKVTTKTVTITVTVTSTKTLTVTKTITTTTTLTTYKTIATTTVTIPTYLVKTITKHTTVTPAKRVHLTGLSYQPYPLKMGTPSKLSLTIYNPNSIKIQAKLELRFFYPKSHSLEHENIFIGKWTLEPSPFEDEPFLFSENLLLDSGSYTSITIDLPSTCWNWIPPPNLLKISSHKTLEVIANIINTNPDLFADILFGATNLLKVGKAVATPLSAIWNTDYKVSINVLDRETGELLFSKEFDIEVDVPEDKITQLGHWFAASITSAVAGILSLVLSVILTGGTVSPLLPLILKLVALVLWGASFGLYLSAYDPDINYDNLNDNIDAIDNISDVKALNEIIDSLPEGAEKRLAEALRDYYSLMNSFTASLTKYYGAAAKGHKDIMVKDLENAESTLRAANQRLQEMIKYLKELGIADEKIQRLTSKRIEEILENVTFSEELQKLIDELGISGYKSGLKMLARSIPSEAFNMTLASYLERLSQINDQQLSHIHQVLEDISKGNEQTKTTIEKTSSTISADEQKLMITLLAYTSIAGLFAVIVLVLLVKRRRKESIEWSTDESIEWIFKFKVISGER